MRRLLHVVMMLATAGAATAQANARAGVLHGVSYTIRVGDAHRPGGGMAGVMGPGERSYVASAVFVAGRGRMDILDGGVESLFGKGDYVLFDSTDLLVVHPATREFVPLPRDAGIQRVEDMESMGFKATVADVKVTLDSLGPGDTISGFPTQHFRMTTAFTMRIDAGVLQRRLATESVTDYWVASVPGLPGNPLLRANGFSGTPVATGMFRELSTKVDSAAARMGNAVALRTTTSSRLIQGPGEVEQMEQTSAVSDIRSRDIDENLLILPQGYKQAALPGLEGAPLGDAGAKWRLPPHG